VAATLRPWLRLLRLGLHLGAGALTILLLFPHLNGEERGRRVTAWARRLIAIMGVRVTVHGRMPAVRGEGALIVANHVSWLDIHLLHSLLHTHFVSKAEVRDWPLVGWLADRAGTLFLERAKKSDARRVNEQMAGMLRDGACLTLFPEGTTSDGTGLKPFYPSLIQPAVMARARIWPAVIRYRRPDGSINIDAAYYDDMSLGESLRRIARQEAIHAEVHFLPPLQAGGQHRREVAAQAEAVIRDVLARDAGDRQSGTAARLPAATR
jgi:1-acyl-sn-glycerol-3-phosphate acyltransferase